jgi:hypothetical protein|tara:strand:+ start:2573 stop:3418 length:846 start_codon:yes stop_codon:yes gene_type:complete
MSVSWELSVSWEYVTPDKAKLFLSQSRGNRTIKRKHIERMLRDVEKGRFYQTHHAMGFDDQGVFVDGHHRCEVVIQSGVPQWFIIVHGISQQALVYLDGGVPRSIQDAIKILHHGESKTNSEIAIARLIECVPSYSQYNYSREEVITILERIGSEIVRSSKARGNSGVTRGAKTLFCRAYILYGEDSEEADRIDEFQSILINGMPISKDSQEDSSAIAYRNYLISHFGQTGQMHELERYRRGQTCLRSFIDRTPMKKAYGSKKDMFPLPDWWEPIVANNDD